MVCTQTQYKQVTQADRGGVLLILIRLLLPCPHLMGASVTGRDLASSGLHSATPRIWDPSRHCIVKFQHTTRSLGPGVSHGAW
ncbi:hypothetical protein GDO81_011208 [Engystomops pustulosus]|uniref:Secreted protein n=1 Tax=Engystomops pustulosus TaxID=76066 RepID=A0AAV7BD19_ENGPU|nr:hypothetical protein GDO81_011208 [Engystomops pustulosus]